MPAYVMGKTTILTKWVWKVRVLQWVRKGTLTYLRLAFLMNYFPCALP